jgi:hypothetical protein
VLVAVQRQKEPEDVLMASSSNGKPPPGGGGGMEVDRPVVRKRAPDTDIGEVLKDTAMAAARARRHGELAKDRRTWVRSSKYTLTITCSKNRHWLKPSGDRLQSCKRSRSSGTWR